MHELNLQYLYEAARLGSMRAAADLLAVAASSISRQIAQLEGEVGTALIERGARRLRLTEAGRLLIEYHEAQLTQREIFEARLSDLKGLRTGRISLAVGEGFVGTPLSTLINGFVCKNPGLQLDVHILASSREVARLVVEDEAHLGLAFDASQPPVCGHAADTPSGGPCCCDPVRVGPLPDVPAGALIADPPDFK